MCGVIVASVVVVSRVGVKDKEKERERERERERV